MIRPKKNVSLAPLTTIGLGGPAKYFYAAKTAEKLTEATTWAIQKKMPYLVIGSGSNLLFPDGGFSGLVIKNEIKGITGYKGLLKADSGTLLFNLVSTSVNQGLSGLQKLAGIPGTVGGAVFGNAGAYGVSIGDCITKVSVLDSEKNRLISLTKAQCSFSYRSSAFKKHPYIILEVHFKLPKGNKKLLQSQLSEILKDRGGKKYWEGKSAGSFFKNVLVSEVSKEALTKIPKEKIIQGKIPAGFLLENVDAKGMKVGKIKVSDNHANLLINTGDGKTDDVIKLAKILQQKVKTKFDITLEPEVQLINRSLHSAP
jgi:UDP-N-acetylmuramate dehydrogenase